MLDTRPLLSLKFLFLHIVCNYKPKYVKIITTTRTLKLKIENENPKFGFFFYLHTRRTRKKGEESYRSFDDLLKGHFHGDSAAVIFGQSRANIRLLVHTVDVPDSLLEHLD